MKIIFTFLISYTPHETYSQQLLDAIKRDNIPHKTVKVYAKGYMVEILTEFNNKGVQGNE